MRIVWLAKVIIDTLSILAILARFPFLLNALTKPILEVNILQTYMIEKTKIKIEEQNLKFFNLTEMAVKFQNEKKKIRR